MVEEKFGHNLIHINFIEGSRSALVNMEARPVTAGTVTRRCIVVKIGELAYDRFKEILEQGAGAILVLLPRNISQYSVEQVQVKTLFHSKIILAKFSKISCNNIS
jgi:hypothetical protein